VQPPWKNRQSRVGGRSAVPRGSVAAAAGWRSGKPGPAERGLREQPDEADDAVTPGTDVFVAGAPDAEGTDEEPVDGGPEGGGAGPHADGAHLSEEPGDGADEGGPDVGRGDDVGEGGPGEVAGAHDGEATGRNALLYPLKHLGGARQLILVMPRSWTGTLARLEAYENGLNGWQRVIGPVQARVGRTGMISAPRRVAGSGTTPAGTFPLTMAFGLEPDPGTALPYVHVTSEDHWWVADPSSAHYNELRLGAAGGFLAREFGNRGSKRIAAHPTEYAHALVIDFNRPFPDRRQGACVSLRVSTGLSTDGSVAVDRDVLVEILRWLDPAKQPMITMAPERVVSQY
jgi:L,D-peptidoglycan transpeptidase YkuD (ErfK/YbiS/YcfS/YnhG family)